MQLDKALAAQADALLAIEQGTEQQVSNILMPRWRKLLGLAIALWPGDDAPDEAKRKAMERVRLNALQPPMALVRQSIKTGAREALTHGLRSAQDEAIIAGVHVSLPESATHLSSRLHARVDHLETSMRKSINDAQRQLEEASSLADITVALSVAKQGVNKAQAVARYATNEASNDALTEVAKAHDDLVSVWHAERDACLHCLAYQGHIDTGDGFPEGLTFGETPLDTGPVDAPPLHPNCRCFVWLMHKDVADPMAASLKREAERSVLRGWSVESESNTARIEAAKRLIHVGTNLPKSVKAYAERAIKKGEFARGRKPPV